MGDQRVSLQELRAEGVVKLGKAGIECAANDAMELLLRVLGTNLTGYAMHLSDPIDEEKVEAYRSLIRRRSEHEPLQYITGEAPFYGRMFTVTPDVLIPRFDSETMVAEAIRLLPENGRILDLCCGSGCLLLTVLAERPDASGTGTDISPAALAVSRENVSRLGVDKRAVFFEGDLFEALTEGQKRCVSALLKEPGSVSQTCGSDHLICGKGVTDDEAPLKFDLIICNPPYIEDEVITTLDPEVRDYEPYLALSGGPDGLAFYRKIVPESKAFLKEGGYLLFEAGPEQTETIRAMLIEEGFVNTAILSDLAGNQRVILGQKD